MPWKYGLYTIVSTMKFLLEQYIKYSSPFASSGTPGPLSLRSCNLPVAADLSGTVGHEDSVGPVVEILRGHYTIPVIVDCSEGSS